MFAEIGDGWLPINNHSARLNLALLKHCLDHAA